MSYLVLARKFRPQTFDQVVGQKPIVKTLQNSLKRDRVAHALLFSGVRGVGKTTLARIMAKALNCKQGPTPTPCDTCQSCREISAGSALDLLEIDGASNRGIQEVRELKDKLKFMPTSSRYKIVIIDEVHMLTNEAFNALLKTLEEPPAHVYFMFATTELHKIPVTILSRCQRFELQRVSSADLSTHFSAVAKSEGIDLEPAALSLIVREAEGSVRDGLSLLDQVLSYGESPISDQDVVEVLGLVKRDVIIAITKALLAGDRPTAIEMLSEAFDFGMDIKRFVTDLLECFRSLLLIKIGGCEHLLNVSETETALFKTLAGEYSAESIHAKLNQLIQTADDIRYSLQPRLTLETAFISIIASGDVVAVDTLLAKLDSALQTLPAGQLDQAQPIEPETAPEPGKSKPEPAGEPKKNRLVETVMGPQPPLPGEPPNIDDQPAMTDAKTPPAAPSHQPAFRLEPATPPAEQAEEPELESEKTKRDVRKDWPEFISFLKKEKGWMAQCLQQTSLVKEVDRDLILEFDDPNDCFMLRKKENRRTLTEFVLDFFQKELSVRIISPDNANGNASENSNTPQKRRQQLAHHQVVRMTEEIFNGKVGDIRISESNK
jgi:DNA polymerase-3 subunit gamma/tau